MSGGSVKALVNGRDPAGDDLHLRAGQCFVMLIVEFCKSVRGQVLDLVSLQVGVRLGGYEAECAIDEIHHFFAVQFFSIVASGGGRKVRCRPTLLRQQPPPVAAWMDHLRAAYR